MGSDKRNKMSDLKPVQQGGGTFYERGGEKLKSPEETRLHQQKRSNI